MKYKVLTNWISILAILFVSLIPIASHALEENQSSDYQVICSSNGLKIISAYNENQNNLDHKLNLNHCTFCTFAVDDKFLIEKVNNVRNLSRFKHIKLINFLPKIKKHPFLSTNFPQAPPSI
jgi:SPX domain protein involved in polyphosphate accumulation